MSFHLRYLILCVGIICEPLSVSSATLAEKLLRPDDAQANAGFGLSTSIDANTCVIGAFQDGPPGVRYGSAYVFVREAGIWHQQFKLVASDPHDNARFGWSVALSGDTCVVGAPLDKAPLLLQGSAYVFVRNGNIWVQQARLTAAGAAVGDELGTSVAISGNTIVVGATGVGETGALAKGAAYVFTRVGTTWTQQAKLSPDDAAANDYFGIAVSISGDRLAVGAYLDDGPAGLDQGSVTPFLRVGSTWTQQAKLYGSSTAHDWLGYGVSITDDTLIAGAPTDSGIGGGSAFVFVRFGSVWSQQARLTAAATRSGDYFGNAVSLDADKAVIAAPGADGPAGTNQGAAYIFSRIDCVWSLTSPLLASDAGAGDTFGSFVGISGCSILIGAFSTDGPAGLNQGSAYLYQPDGGDSDGDEIVDGCDQCPGTIPGAIVDSRGCPVPIPGDFDLDADVDQSDFGFLQRCLSGPAKNVSFGCDAARLDGDSDADEDDVTLFLHCMTGSQVAANPHCLQ